MLSSSKTIYDKVCNYSHTKCIVDNIHTSRLVLFLHLFLEFILIVFLKSGIGWRRLLVGWLKFPSKIFIIIVKSKSPSQYNRSNVLKKICAREIIRNTTLHTHHAWVIKAEQMKNFKRMNWQIWCFYSIQYRTLIELIIIMGWK